MKFSEYLKQERLSREMGPRQFAEYIGTGYETVKAWESGKSIPQNRKVVETGIALDWPDEVIIGHCQYLPKGEGFFKDLSIRSLLLELSQRDLNKAVGIPSSVSLRVRKGDPLPEKYETRVLALLRLSDNDFIEEVVPGATKSSNLDYNLIKELEAEYGQLSAVPENNKTLKKLRKELNVL